MCLPQNSRKKANGTELKEAVLSLWVDPPHPGRTLVFLGLECVEAAPSASAMLMFAAGKSFVAGARPVYCRRPCSVAGLCPPGANISPSPDVDKFSPGSSRPLRKAGIRHKDGRWSLRESLADTTWAHVPALSLPAPPWSPSFISALSFSSIKWDDSHQANHICCKT